MKYKVVTRDWRGGYDSFPKGWKVLAGEDKVDTGQDCFATIFYKGSGKPKLTGQEVYDIHDNLLCGEEVDGYDLDEDDNLVERS